MKGRFFVDEAGCVRDSQRNDSAGDPEEMSEVEIVERLNGKRSAPPARESVIEYLDRIIDDDGWWTRAAGHPDPLETVRKVLRVGIDGRRNTRESDDLVEVLRAIYGAMGNAAAARASASDVAFDPAVKQLAASIGKMSDAVSSIASRWGSTKSRPPRGTGQA